jgi:hypothetical protein
MCLSSGFVAHHQEFRILPTAHHRFPGPPQELTDDRFDRRHTSSEIAERKHKKFGQHSTVFELQMERRRKQAEEKEQREKEARGKNAPEPGAQHSLACRIVTTTTNPRISLTPVVWRPFPVSPTASFCRDHPGQTHQAVLVLACRCGRPCSRDGRAAKSFHLCDSEHPSCSVWVPRPCAGSPTRVFAPTRRPKRNRIVLHWCTASWDRLQATRGRFCSRRRRHQSQGESRIHTHTYLVPSTLPVSPSHSGVIG